VRQAYAKVMADLLGKERGDGHRAVKLLMPQADADERVITHWLAAQHGRTIFSAPCAEMSRLCTR
jgi:hypothetical protein